MNVNDHQPPPSEIRARLQFLIELFYGLAIASGLQFATTYVLDPGNGFELMTPRWCLAMVAILISTAIAILDWMSLAARPQSPKTELRILLFDLLFPLSLYSLFVTSFRPVLFLAAIMGYALLALVWFVWVDCWNEKRRSRILVYLAVLVSCSLVVVPRLLEFSEARELVLSVASLKGREWQLIALIVIIWGMSFTAGQRREKLKELLENSENNKRTNSPIQELSKQVSELQAACQKLQETVAKLSEAETAKTTAVETLRPPV